jgi:pilus assembly protein FimV
MNLRKIAVHFLIVLSFVTAIPAANSQQGNLRGPKNSTPRYSEPQPQPQDQRQELPQSQRGTQFADTYGPIVSSDTLWQISQNYRSNSTQSIYQVMQAIYELNPDAFEQQNINLLKDGSILRMPSEAYISGINTKQAQAKAELDSQKLKSNTSNQVTQQASNTAALDQTRELIEQKLGAIDEAQTRQFTVIRNQFSESINSVQSILDENKKLFERLNKVNTDIDEMRSEEQQKSLQMNQMGESIEELLEKSRKDDALKAAQMAEKETSWLDSPITLILLFTLPVLLVLTAFAYWIIKRKAPVVVKPEEDDVDDLSLDPLATEMDDLSDALSAELSGEDDDGLDDDKLFGDDDLLDDVLSEELEESLDDALEDSIEDSLVDDSENFDDLGDDVLDDLLEEEFEVGAEVVEQDDLDSLFDEDDDLLAEVEEDEQQVDAEVDDMEYEEDESQRAPVEADVKIKTESVVDDEEQPEISIDDLLNESEDESVANPLIDDSDDINEEVLQNLDKEIISQNEELDSVTGTLIDELEQVEQMRSMLPDDDEELLGEDEPQLGIQRLDDLAEKIDEDVLGDDFDEEDTDDEIEVDISEVLNEPQQPVSSEESVEADELVEREQAVEPEPSVEAEEIAELESSVEADEITEPESLVEAEEIAEPESSVEADESVEPEPSVEAEEIAEPESSVEAEEVAEPEPSVEAEEITEPESSVEAEEIAEPEPSVEAEEITKPESSVEAEEIAEPESSVEAEESVEPEPSVEAEEIAQPDSSVEAEESVEPEPSVEAEEIVEPEASVEAEEIVEPEASVEAEESVEPAPSVEAEEIAEPEASVEAEESVEYEPSVEAEEIAEPESSVEAEESAEPEQAVEAEESVEPEQAVEAEELVEPEPSVEGEELTEPEQAVDAEESAESEQAVEAEESDGPEQAVETEESVEPEKAIEAEELVEPEPSVKAEESAEPEQAVEAEESDEPEQTVETEELAEPEPPVEAEDSAEPEQAVESEELTDDSLDEDDDFDTELSTDFEMPANSDSTLDEDQLEKALEDFEKEELDEVLEDLTSNEPASISSLDDLEFSADNFVTKNQPSEPFSSPSPAPDDAESLEDFDDSELDNAFDETVDGLSFESSQNSRDELDDLPGLGDWLDDDDVKPNQKQSNADEDDDGIIEELEGSSFDEMLESIDLDDDLSPEEDNTGFDIAALLDEATESKDIDVNEQEVEDFLDVEALLNESVSAESDDEIDKALDLDIPLEPFVNEQDNLEMIDVDADDGLGAKLDLAHAYIEIGEDDSAKDLLDEILQKGTAEQIAEVKIILNKLD